MILRSRTEHVPPRWCWRSAKFPRVDQSLGGGVPVRDPQSALPPAPLGAGHHLARSGRSACIIHPSSHLHSPDRAPDRAGSFLDVPNQQCNGK